MKAKLASLWAAASSLMRREPTVGELTTGFPCGAADQFLFNELMMRALGSEQELGNLLERTGIAASESDLFQVVKAVRSNRLNWYTAGGTADAITLTPNPTFAALADLIGVPLRFIATAASTGPVTVNVNGLGAVPVVARGGVQIGRGAITLGALIEVMYDGTNFVFSPLSLAGGRLIGTRVITATSTFNPTAGATLFRIRMIGGGGAGGGATLPSAGNVSLGAPGQCGAYAEAILTAADIGAGQVAAIGAGGVAAAGFAGGNGASTSLGALVTAPGGLGGGMLNNQAAPTINGNGTYTSAPAGANVVGFKGSSGSPTIAVSATTGAAGPGGDSSFGRGGVATGINSAGVDASGYGSGGSGCLINNSYGGTGVGGAGMPGIIIIEEYAM